MNERHAIRKMLRDNPEAAKALREAVESGKIKSVDEMSLTDEIVVVGGPWPGQIVGNKLVNCEDCGSRLAISPSTQAMIAIRKAFTHIKCMPCAAETKPVVIC